MARLPTLADLGARPTPRLTRAMASVDPRAAAAPAAALEGFGATMVDVGAQMQDREDTAAAKERDAYVSDQIRKLLYDPESGFLGKEGRNALDARGATSERLNGLIEDAKKGLSPAAARKMEDVVRRRVDGALQSVDTHTMGARNDWINGAASARIESAYQDGLFQPEKTAESLRIMESEVRGIAAREGWDSAKTDLEVTKRRSALLAAQSARIANADPVMAMEYLRENQDKMLPSDVVEIERVLTPEIKRRAGRAAGQEAFAGRPSHKHSTRIDYSLGPARPYKPNKPVLDVVGAAAEDVFGPGARIVVTSGQEGDKKQHGSNRHKTGNAADIAIYRPDGTRVRATDPDMQAFARAAANRGATGIGFGMEYMGGEHIHVDLVKPGPGQAHTWGSGGKGMGQELVGIMQRPGSINNLRDLMEEPDPLLREAGIQRYTELQALDEAETKARRDAMAQEAFAHIEAGGLIDDMPIDFRQELGIAALSALRTYQSKVRAKEPIATDPEAYLGLRRVQGEDPETFRSIDLLEFRDKLSDADFKSFVDAQTKPLADVGVATSTLMGIGDRVMEAAGIDTNPDTGSDDAKRLMNVQVSVQKWQDRFIAENKRPPSQAEITEKFRQEVAPIIIDRSGLFNKQEIIATDDLEMDQSFLSELMREDGVLNIAGQSVPAHVVKDIRRMIIRDGEPFTMQTLTEYYFDLTGGVR